MACAVYDSLQAARARRDEHGARRGAVPRGCWKFKVGYRKFTQERRQALCGITIGFWAYFKVGAPLTLLTILFGAWWL